jgi:hypothetical protein
VNWHTKPPKGFFYWYYKGVVKEPNMSTLQNEMILENCFDEAWENFRVSNKLTVDEMTELFAFSQGTRIAIERNAQKMFDDMCQ